MTTTLIPRRDMAFLLYEWLNIEAVCDHPAFAEHSRETFDAMLDLSERLAEDFFLPHYKAADQYEPKLDGEGVHILPAIGHAMSKYAELGLFAAGFPAEMGGIGLPYTVALASFAYFAAANVAIAAYPMLTGANARLITTFGTVAQIDMFAKPEIEGRWFGTMCLSEPQAGSGLADVRTRAVWDGEDALGVRYRLTGNKMWISGGDQNVSENIVHLVLAKAQNDDGTLTEGTEGLSLFIVPKILPDGQRNDVVVAGLNHKMGYRGTANCLLNLGESGGAVGWIVGEPGSGLRQMFLMMNEARIGVGMGAAALGYRGYRLALAYAKERLQGRPIGERRGAPVALIEHADVKRMLLTQKAYVEGALALCLYCAKLVDEPDDVQSVALLGLLTPVAKTWPSEYGLAANDIAIQIHGGYGYTRDFDVEQLYRDNRLNPIHEGTTGIQGMDIVGRKILRDNGAGLAVLEARIKTCIDRAKSKPELTAHSEALTMAWGQVTGVVEILRSAPGARAFDNATAFLWAFGHVVLAWLWLEQAVVAAEAQLVSPDQTFYLGKLRACRFFFEVELPKIGAWLAPVAALSDVASSASPDIF